MNPRRVAITATALFGTVILVGGVIAAVAGFEMGEASVSNADAVSAATAVAAITKAALPDGGVGGSRHCDARGDGRTGGADR
jgi:hypothetical protein